MNSWLPRCLIQHYLPLSASTYMSSLGEDPGMAAKGRALQRTQQSSMLQAPRRSQNHTLLGAGQRGS